MSGGNELQIGFASQTIYGICYRVALVAGYPEYIANTLLDETMN
jgi:hypothetical protein